MKVAALDFDGTLYHRRADGSHSFNPADLEAIRAWREAGHLAVAATGRSRSALSFALAPELEFDYRVLSNGASATTGDGAELLFSYPIDLAILTAAVEEFAAVPGLAVFGTTVGPVDGMFVNNTGAADEFTAHFTPMTLDDAVDHTFAVVPIWVPDSALRPSVVAWARQFPQVTVAQNQDYVDIMAAGRSKGAGLMELFSTIGLDRSDVELFTFGDSWNDLDMHSLADASFSFPHSPSEVRAATDHVIDAVADVLAAHL